MRRSREMVLMDAALAFAARSTCKRGPFGSVGAVVAIEGRIIATGYNGAPSGMAHCDHTCTCDNQRKYAAVTGPNIHPISCPAEQPCQMTVHAEANAIVFAAKHGTATNGADMFTTVSPCHACAKLIINAGIVRVWYLSMYRDPHPIDLLAAAGVDVRDINE